MQSVDVNDSKNNIESRIKALKTYRDLSASEKKSRRDTQNSFQQKTSELANQLNKITEQQKRFQRSIEDRYEQMTNFIKSVGGGGNQTATEKYIRSVLLEVVTKIEPDIQEIILKSSLKALGCSEEQSYNSINLDSYKTTLEEGGFLPEDQKIIFPVQSIDILFNLKKEPDTNFGKFYYEKPEPSSDPEFKPYGGFESFPMNKLLNLLMQEQNQGKYLSQVIGEVYNGISNQPLFDMRYVTVNQFGVTGNFFEIILIQRSNDGENTVGSFLSDYFKTIKIVDSVSVISSLVQSLTGAISMSTNSGVDDIKNQSKFEKIIQRILGLCFDSRQEIDVSGVAKIAELDGVDDSFFELTEVDLREIDVEIANIQQGVVEFIDCDVVKVPVDFTNLTDQLIVFREFENDLTNGEKVEQMSEILDTISQVNIPSNNEAISTPQFNISVNNQIISKLPVAVISSILTPKTLLPIFAMLAVAQSKASVTYNEAVTANNTLVDPVNNASNQTTNLISDASDFIKKFRSFSIEVSSDVSQIFLNALFDILKRDILSLLRSTISDIIRTRVSKKYRAILRLLQCALIITQLLRNFKKCKSLLNSIENILNLINGFPTIQRQYPDALLLFSPLLPGISPERGTINAITLLQDLGIDTGPNTDGSPNLMLQFLSSTIKGYDSEISENGKIEGFGITPPVAGGRVELFAKLA